MTILDVNQLLQQKWPEWKVVRFIGEGAYGQVYEIQKVDFGVAFPAALKVIRIPNEKESLGAFKSGMSNLDVSEYYKSAVENVMREYIIMSKLKGNSYIVSCEDYVCMQDSDDIGWIILVRMELLTSLTSFIQQHGLSRQGLIKLGIDICKALELCKKHKVVHRDIKPDNVFVSDSGDYKLGDFGVSKTLEGTQGMLSKQGTSMYMAPEVYANKPYGPSVDIYSLGLMMYQYMNMNKAPFITDKFTYNTQMESLTRRMSGEKLPLPSQENGSLAAIVLKACSFLPEDRYTEPELMRRDLEKLVDLSDQFQYQLPSKVSPQPTIQIRFLDENNALISSKLYFPGEVVETPALPDHERNGYRYRFSGWRPNLTPYAEMDADYLAVWDKTPIKVVEPDAPPTHHRKKTWIIFVGIGVALCVAGALWISGVLPPQPPEPTPTPTIITEPPPSTSGGVKMPIPGEVQRALEWTDWDDAMPDGVTGDKYAIECRQIYRTTSLVSIEGDAEEPGDGFVLFDTKYGEWGEWSEWQAVPIESNDTTDVDEPKTERNWIPAITSSFNQPKGVNYWIVPGTRPTKYEWDAGHYSDVTLYRSRTRSATKLYYNNNEWSLYKDSLIAQKDGTLINMKMQYRYAENDGEALREASMENFAITSADYQGHYYDVPANAWYGPEKSRMLQTVDELGILLPDSYMRFRPEENMTIGQLIRAAVIINRIYNGYEGLICKNDGQYQAYAKYAEDAGLIIKGEFPDLDRPATRQEMAYVFYNALPLECLEAINQIDSITDMDMSRKYYECALTMARAGVISVSEGNTFHPEDGATRAQAAAMIEKLVHPGSRTKA